MILQILSAIALPMIILLWHLSKPTTLHYALSLLMKYYSNIGSEIKNCFIKTKKPNKNK